MALFGLFGGGGVGNSRSDSNQNINTSVINTTNTKTTGFQDVAGNAVSASEGSAVTINQLDGGAIKNVFDYAKEISSTVDNVQKNAFGFATMAAQNQAATTSNAINSVVSATSDVLSKTLQERKIENQTQSEALLNTIQKVSIAISGVVGVYFLARAYKR